jgi:hypothetical protein
MATRSLKPRADGTKIAKKKPVKTKTSVYDVSEHLRTPEEI